MCKYFQERWGLPEEMWYRLETVPEERLHYSEMSHCNMADMWERFIEMCFVSVQGSHLKSHTPEQFNLNDRAVVHNKFCCYFPLYLHILVNFAVWVATTHLQQNTNLYLCMNKSWPEHIHSPRGIGRECQMMPLIWLKRCWQLIRTRGLRLMIYCVISGYR